MAHDLTQYVKPENEAGLRAKAEALGLDFNRYLTGIVEGEPWGWGENDPDPSIDRFLGAHADATGGWVPWDEVRAEIRSRRLRRA